MKIQKRRRREKRCWASIGVCAVEQYTAKAILVVLPAGRKLWIPRTVVQNGNMRFKRGQVLRLLCDHWFTCRERIRPVVDGPGFPTEAEQTDAPNAEGADEHVAAIARPILIQRKTDYPSEARF